ncbi:MAG: aminopeptidase P family protein [Lachnospiraceae bacterium]
MIQERLRLLRERMKESGVTVYVIPSSDCHESEYVCGHYRARAYITGFTGSAGTAIVTLQDAGLWTDGRYFIQAQMQLQDTGIRLFRTGEPGVPTVEAYVKEHLEKGGRLGFDGTVMGAFRAEALMKAAEEKEAGVLATEDLVGAIWKDRPEIPDAPVFILEERYCGESAKRKLMRVREKLKELGADIHVIASLCDIAWILNIRGGDIPGVPVTLSYLCITKDTCVWYARSSVVTEELRSYLSENEIQVKEYGTVYQDLSELGPGLNVLMDKRKVNYRLLTSIPQGAKLIDKSSPSELMKAVKNETELKNLRIAHLKESIAFTRLMYWVKTNVRKQEMTELSVSEYLNERRKEQEHYLGESFSPICAYGPNAAIVHYSADRKSNAAVEAKGFLLVDAGGHYLEGTTDTTRTFVLGELTEEQKRMFTAVCRANLNLANARFLYGCTGYTLDVLCREPLWQLGTDYKHGTGHGVGYLLNVHEGPNAFRWKAPEGEKPAVLEAGMVTTDEPGIYVEGEYGIRTENELVCVKGTENEYGQFMEFEIVTLVPIDLDGIVPEEMTLTERKYLNDYHQKVYNTLSSYLSGEEREWLKVSTRGV